MENTFSLADAEALSKIASDYLRAAVVPIVEINGTFSNVSVAFTWGGRHYEINLREKP
jgi:hypothetical protein